MAIQKVQMMVCNVVLLETNADVLMKISYVNLVDYYIMYMRKNSVHVHASILFMRVRERERGKEREREREREGKRKGEREGRKEKGRERGKEREREREGEGRRKERVVVEGERWITE